DRAHALGAVCPCVCGPAGDREPETTQTLARGLEVAVLRARLDDERGGDAFGCRLEQRAPGWAAHLLVRRQEHAQRPPLVAGAPDCLEQHDETRLHVVRSEER